MSDRDLYKILGVARKASAAEIKKVYRRLARKFHPDVNPGNKAAEDRFKEVSAAFEILSDTKKRELYDEFGEDGLRTGFDPEQTRAYQQWQQRSRATSAGSGGDFGGFDLDDLFGGRTSGRPFDGARRGGDVRASMSIEFRDAVLGCERQLAFDRPTTCGSCQGIGTKAGSAPDTCKTCGGTGQMNIARGPLDIRATCQACAGSGKTPGPACDACRGEGFTEKEVKLAVKVPAGIGDGQAVRLGGQGMPGRHGGTAGDLYIDISVRPHPLLKRLGRDLELGVPITIQEALMGAKIDVPTLTGTIKLTVPKASQNGQRLRIKGFGVGGSSPGDLYVVLRVRMPDPSVNSEIAETAAKELQKLYLDDVRASLRL
jgi:molecular chaperone DnaJ